jgi:hypothetical protein
LGDVRGGVKVVGARAGEFDRHIVPRQRVIIAAPWTAAAVEKWTRNKCIVPYDPEKHVDAVLESEPVQRPTFPAWIRAEEPGRKMEREMAAMEVAARREARRQG